MALPVYAPARIPDVEELPVYALARIPDVEALPVYALARIPDVEELPVYALARIPDVEELPVNDLPGTLTTTKLAAYPARYTVEPPTRYFGIEEVRVALKSRWQVILDPKKPDMARVKVALIWRPIGPLRHALRVILNRTPRIA
jgi:hypothetical protein